MIEVKIKNILVLKFFSQKLILNLIATLFKKVKYKPERLTGFVYELKESSCGRCIFDFNQTILIN